MCLKVMKKFFIIFLFAISPSVSAQSVTVTQDILSSEALQLSEKHTQVSAGDSQVSDMMAAEVTGFSKSDFSNGGYVFAHYETETKLSGFSQIFEGSAAGVSENPPPEISGFAETVRKTVVYFRSSDSSQQYTVANITARINFTEGSAGSAGVIIKSLPEGNPVFSLEGNASETKTAQRLFSLSNYHSYLIEISAHNTDISKTGIAEAHVSIEPVSDNSDPCITSVSPLSCFVSENPEVTITGYAFGESRGKVRFGSREADCGIWTDTRIICTVPSPDAAGKVDVSVTDTNNTASVHKRKFEYVLSATVTLHMPESAEIGETVSAVINVDPPVSRDVEISLQVSPDDYFSDLPDKIIIPKNSDSYVMEFPTAGERYCNEQKDIFFTVCAENDEFVKGCDTGRVAFYDRALCVGEDYQYKTIQSAINASVSGNKIYVMNKGGPYESVNINRQNLTITSPDNAVIKGSSEPVVKISRGGTVLEGFVIDCPAETGIYILAADNCTVTDNEIKNASVGMYIASNSNRILNNSFSLIGQNSIFLNASGNNIVCGNTFAQTVQSAGCQICTYASSDNVISDNVFSDSDQTDDDSVSIRLDSSHRNSISGNRCKVIQLGDSSYNLFMENELDAYDIGIRLLGSDYNAFLSNRLSAGDRDGVSVDISDSGFNSFYRNIFNSGSISMTYSTANMFFLNKLPGVLSKAVHSPSIWNIRAYCKYKGRPETESMMGNFHGSPDLSDADGVVKDTDSLLPDNEPDDYYRLAVSPGQYISGSDYAASVWWLNSDSRMHKDGVCFRLTEQALNDLDNEGASVSGLDVLKDAEYEKESMFLGALDDLEDEMITRHKFDILKHAYVYKPAGVLLNAGESLIWTADRNEQGAVYNACAGQIVADSTHIVTSAEEDIRVDIGFCDDKDGNGYTSFQMPPDYIRTGGGTSKAVSFRISDFFAVPPDKYLAVKVINTSGTVPYKILTGGARSCISLSEIDCETYSESGTVIFSPSENEIFYAGSRENAFWDPDGICDTVDKSLYDKADISVSYEGSEGTFIPVAKGIPNNGEFRWAVINPNGADLSMENSTPVFHVLTNVKAPSPSYPDINNNGRLGFAEAVYSIQKSANLRIVEGPPFKNCFFEIVLKNSTDEEADISTVTGPFTIDVFTPDPPSNIWAVPPGEGKITVSWDPSEGNPCYNIYYATQPGVDKENFSSLGGKKIEDAISPYTISNLTDDTTYYIVMTAGKDAEESSGSGEVSAMPIYRKIFTDSLGTAFVRIPPGTYMMGSPESEPGRDDDENLCQVIIKEPFYMQTTEVIQKVWKEIMGDNPSWFDYWSSDYPVESVVMSDIQAFISKMNARGGGTYRLPTEAEWEYAARAGTGTAVANGDLTVGEDCNHDPNLDAIGWYCANRGDLALIGRTNNVGKKQPNSWGLYDMHGNVWEMCQDLYGSSTDYYVKRGGSAFNKTEECRSANRKSHSATDYNYSTGFRLVLERNP